ncbi:hypothetical protein [Bacillus alkalicellulosilyticus]|uniref:hypothetical protein n=1 Tax=Alkalihalobacterium alkalicellulosilyticum TaxID=1912214 RepID=UPI00099743AE|nr:hypothetical protein [Bacillus alkalicellulosilyticus]
MPKHFYEAEFSSLYIKLTKDALHEFIRKLMDENFSLYWRYENDTIFLIIDNENALCEIPFVRNEDFLTLHVDQLTVNDEIIVEALEVIISEFSGNGVVKKSTGGPLYITSYKTGDIQSIIEIDGSDKIIMNKNGSIIEYREYDHNLEPQTIFHMTNLEIDYELMELHEAIVAEDEQRVRSHKKRLKKLVNRRKEVAQFL